MDVVVALAPVAVVAPAAAPVQARPGPRPPRLRVGGFAGHAAPAQPPARPVPAGAAAGPSA